MIHKLAETGNARELRNLLAKTKAAVRFRDDQGWTALHHAAKNGKLKAAEILLDHKADPNALTTNNLFSPMDVANGPRRKEFIKLMRNRGGHFSNITLHSAVESGDVETIEELLEDEETKINERDERGWMPIHYAVDYDELDIVKLLLTNGANVNGGTLDELNPMEIAKDNNNAELQEYLKSAGGKLNVYRGRTKKPVITKWVKSAEKKPEYDPEEMFPKQKPRKGLFAKMSDKLSGEDKRQAELDRQQKLVEQKIQLDKLKAEEDRIKRSRVIKWKWGEDPFKCKGDSLNYDRPCEGYIFFMDIVAYSKKSTAQQKQVSDELSRMVKATPEFQRANRAGKLIILPTGDGMVLAFFTSVKDSFCCALNVSKQVFKHADIGLRMGVHYGPLVPIKDINDNPNVSGDGINMAQRVMDAGDSDHLLISNAVFYHINDMKGLQFEDYGPVFVKHGMSMHLQSVYGSNFGRKEFPHWRVKKA
mgnify:FL=1